MTPFIVPNIDDPTEILNLNSIKRICDLDAGKIAVHFVDGKILTYEGQPAAVIKGSAHMARRVYESWIMSVLNPSSIVTPGGGQLM